ncbi:MAG: asparagine synthase (glutamine-hydrolyzing) [Bacteroidetes bacterium MedPE-SWsnd-G2]|nr:MAG: asparagine synthase (glutamine-hydrolyzing) [Bacteroidetes bacterium MedPE-SWsnd-G2]
MCGINGIIYHTKQDDLKVQTALTEMNDLIVHRGPDDSGTCITPTPFGSIGMAMRRLSIIDLHTGQQPMCSDNALIGIVFNGEIYNYRTLKSELESEGLIFKTNSDTEVILKLYETKGAKAFSKLDGMFAFSLFDKSINKVYLARDFFGEKPLYYSQQDSKFIWGSELKSIINNLNFKPEIDKTGLNLFLRLTYIPAPFTIYENIKKLEPNQLLTYCLESHSFKISSIFDTPAIETQKIGFDEAKTEVKNKVNASVESRSIADVPLGTFLSGGVDSSVVSLCLANQSDAKIDTFSIGFEKKSYDETDKSRTVAKLINSNHHEFIINESDIKKNIDDVLLNFDEPFADSSALPTYLVSQKTKSQVKVALTGDGGDEVFGGYNKYYIGKLNSNYTKIVPQYLHQGVSKFSSHLLKRKDDNRGIKYKLNKLLNAIDYNSNFYWDIIALGFNETDIATLLPEKSQQSNLFEYYKSKSGISKPKSINDFRTIDRHLSLEGDMLVKVDRTSMLNSLECRAPFLNRDLYNYVSNLPENYLINKWSKKHILKAAFQEQFPKGFLDISKQGFGVPVGDWLREGLKPQLVKMIDQKFLDNQHIFESNQIITLVKNHLSGKEDNTFKVWPFFCFQKWYLNTYLNL